MRKLVFITFFSGAMLLASGANVSFAQMTDTQVVEYVKKANAAGKSETQIGRELLAKGVTTDQLQRIKNNYSNSNGGAVSESSSYVNPRSKSSSVQKPAGQMSGQKPNTQRNDRNRQNVSGRNRRIEQPGDSRAQGQNGDYLYPDEYGYGDEYGDEYGYEEVPYLDEFGNPRDTSGIFGHAVFNSTEMNFEPNENVATPENYKLGPGDEIIVELWGNNEANIRETISPEGSISISQIGRVMLSGLTIKEATAKFKKILASKYENASNLTVTLGSIRTIQVNVMGEVNIQGTYRLSSFSTVFNAIYRAGGVTAAGSLRNISVLRDGKIAGTADIYGYIFNGATDKDITLRDGDVIMVPAYDKIVEVKGEVKRPMKYELTGNESLDDAIRYAGGFTGNAYRDYISISRNTGKGLTTVTTSANEMQDCLMADGDVVNVLKTIGRKKGGVEVQGYVFQPGEYEYGNGITTVSQLVRAAGGLREDAFLNRAVIQRENDDLSFSTLSVDLGAVMKGTAPDVRLRDNDVLIIPGIYEIQDRGTLTINGMVANPGVFEYAENTTVEDLIILAGGLLDGASLSKVDVSRRISDPYGLEKTEIIGESYSFAIKDGLLADGADTFFLEPYDVVSVRQSPAFMPQQFVTVEGEVAFPGQYVLQSTGERLSSVIERAGGITNLAYLKGGKLTRQLTEEERETAMATLELARRGATKDSLRTDQLAIKASYTVAVDFEKAMSNPGSIYDIILREGDKLSIPENVGTVTIKGEVLFPNTVMYSENKPLGYYIDMAGGYNTTAKRSMVYVVYQNGTVAKGHSAKLEPGCEVVVPKKPDRNRMSTAEVISLGTSAASMGTMIVSLINLIGKK